MRARNQTPADQPPTRLGYRGVLLRIGLAAAALLGLALVGAGLRSLARSLF